MDSWPLVQDSPNLVLQSFVMLISSWLAFFWKVMLKPFFFLPPYALLCWSQNGCYCYGWLRPQLVAVEIHNQSSLQHCRRPLLNQWTSNSDHERPKKVTKSTLRSIMRKQIGLWAFIVILGSVWSQDSTDAPPLEDYDKADEEECHYIGSNHFNDQIADMIKVRQRCLKKTSGKVWRYLLFLKVVYFLRQIIRYH